MLTYRPYCKDMNKDMPKDEDTSHRFGSKDLRGDKGMTNKTTDNLAREDDMMMLGMMYYRG